MTIECGEFLIEYPNWPQRTDPLVICQQCGLVVIRTQRSMLTGVTVYRCCDSFVEVAL